MLAPAGTLGFGASFAVLKARDGAPANGALISTTDRKTSGRESTHQAATPEP